MNAFTYRMPAGIPGAISRAAGSALIEPQIGNSAAAFPRYGMFGKIVSEKCVPLEAGDAAGVIYGALVRPYPTTSSQDGLGTSTPPTSGVLDIMRRGYMTVLLAQGVAAKNGQVYVRTAAASGKAVGDIEAGADSGNCVAVANCVFTGPADANGIVEIEFRQ